MAQRSVDLPTISALGHDLLQVTWYQMTWSLFVPFACCGAYFYFATHHLWPLAMLSLVYLSFITYASISHDLVHRTLGLPKFWNDFFLSIIELLTLHSGHAYQKAHLHHHRTYPRDEDIEGAASKLSFLNALFCGVLFQVRIWLWALKVDQRNKTLILSEGLLCWLIVGGAMVLHRIAPVFSIYVFVMIVGSWIIPFATSFVPHDPFQADPLRQTRLFRGKVFSMIALEHLYHLEHHLYPSVPHYHWPKLAKRLDPFFQEKGIEPIKLLF